MPIRSAYTRSRSQLGFSGLDPSLQAFEDDPPVPMVQTKGDKAGLIRPLCLSSHLLADI